MEGLSLLFAFCAAMFFGAYIAGMIPMSCTMHESKLRLVTIFGAGLLVGTALIVIIPEGVAMHYNAQLHKHEAGAAAASVSPAAAPAALLHEAHAGHAHLRHLAQPEPLSAEDSPGGGLLGSLVRAGRRIAAAATAAAASAAGGAERAAASAPGGVAAAGAVLEGEHGHDHGHADEKAGGDAHGAHGHGDGHWHIGAALALGFAFQLVVDRLAGGLGHGHGSGAPPPASPAAVLPASAASSDAGGGEGGERNVLARGLGQDDAKSRSAMVGLVVHAAVDGVALGAAVREGDATLGMLVFMAIMLHKAPSAFGLASYLLHHGVSAAGVRARMLVFSCAAPLGALGTYALLAANLFEAKEELLAVLLLFSGGTFLYVATAHILPEVQAGGHAHSGGGGGDDDEDGHSHAGGGSSARAKSSPRMRWREVWLLVAGVLLPLLLNLQGHGH